MKKSITVTFILFAIAILYAPTALTAPQYSVAPLVIDESVKPRDIITETITLTHTGGEPVTLYPTVNNISLKEGGTIEEFLPPVDSDMATSLASWIEMSRIGIELKPGETKTLEISFRINPKAVPGEYHAFVGFGYGRNRDEAETQVRSGRAPGTVVNVTVEDTTFSFLKIAAFVVDRFITKADNQAAVYTFENPGDETLVPTGEIIIYDPSGKEIDSLPVNAEKIEVPPGGTHVFSATVPTQGLFGKYKAFLSVEYGGDQRGSVQDTNFFYVIPLNMLLLIGFVLLALSGSVAWYTHKRYLDGEIEENDQLRVHVRTTRSEPKDHDLHITRS